jgi:uncharacterized membrane protein
MIYPIISYGLVFILVGGVQAALPAYSRRTIFFSVTVPDRFRETADARSILRQFRRLILLWTLAAEVLALATIHTGNPWLLLAAILVMGAGTVAAYARARKQTRQFSVTPSAERTASLAAQSDGLRGSYLMLAVAVAPFIAAALFARARWNQIPDTVALSTAFGVSGSVDVVLLLLALAILHGSRRGSPMRSVNLTVLIAFMLVNSVAPATFTALQWIEPSEQFWGQAFSFGELLFLAGTVVWGLRKGSQSRDSWDTTPDDCWKLGQFYYNPQDPALLVEHRIGLGYSPNFARPLSWIAMTALFLLPVLVVVSLTVANM